MRIVPNPFDITLELQYNCASGSWELPAFSDQEYGEVITVRRFTNLERVPLSLEFGGQLTELPPGVPTPLTLPVRFPSIPWRARLSSGASPVCGGSGTVNPGDPTTPPPVRITVSNDCPTQ